MEIVGTVFVFAQDFTSEGKSRWSFVNVCWRILEQVREILGETSSVRTKLNSLDFIAQTMLRGKMVFTSHLQYHAMGGSIPGACRPGAEAAVSGCPGVDSRF